MNEVPDYGRTRIPLPADTDTGHADMQRRKMALVNAREYVTALYQVKNDKGFPMHTASAALWLEQELAVARFLLAVEE
jgi:hypothetical protein